MGPVNGISARLARALYESLRALKRSYVEQRHGLVGVEQVGLASLVAEDTRVRLSGFAQKNGNLGIYEVFAISCLVANEQPRRVLEIGSFDGNTTLQMAINAPEDAVVYTLDLPDDAREAVREVDPNDWQYIRKPEGFARRYAGHAAGAKVRQRFGDSASFDFGEFSREGSLDFIFIDGSHSYAYVKNDTEKSLEILRPGGCLLWHDYTRNFPGVYRYLNEMRDRMPLRHIEGTRLVYCKVDRR